MKILRYPILSLGIVVLSLLGYMFLELFVFSSEYESYGNKIIVHGLLTGRQEFIASGPNKGICEQISPKLYSIPFMNGGGQQIMYVRSYCFWQGATQNKDATLCSYVVEKKHFLYDGSHYTAASCVEDVKRLQS